MQTARAGDRVLIIVEIDPPDRESGSLSDDVVRDRDPRHETNQAAYRRLKESIDAEYPTGHVVAIAGDAVIACAENFRELDRRLNEMGRASRDILVAVVGAEVPEMTWIL